MRKQQHQQQQATAEHGAPILGATHQRILQTGERHRANDELQQAVMAAKPLSLAEAATEYAAQTARFRAIAKAIKLEAQ